MCVTQLVLGDQIDKSSCSPQKISKYILWELNRFKLVEHDHTQNLVSPKVFKANDAVAICIQAKSDNGKNCIVIRIRRPLRVILISHEELE